MRGMRKGIPVSPGVAVGTAYCIDEVFVNPAMERLEDNQVLGELSRFETARRKTAADLHSLYENVASQVDDRSAAIFQAHESILYDPAFTEKIRNAITHDRQSAQAALHSALNDYVSLFARTKDAYLRERLTDIRDVVIRLSGHLSDVLHAPDNKSPL